MPATTLKLLLEELFLASLVGVLLFSLPLLRLLLGLLALGILLLLVILAVDVAAQLPHLARHLYNLQLPPRFPGNLLHPLAHLLDELRGELQLLELLLAQH